MSKPTRKLSRSQNREYRGRTRFEHWCVDDQVYFITAYRYILIQGQRHGCVREWRDYPHTRVNVEMERAIKRAHEPKAFMEGVPYKRYLK